MKKLVIFDLDGTLLNSIIDIGESMNVVLKKHNYPLHSMEDYKQIIGRGIDNLVIDSLPQGIDKKKMSQYIVEMRDVYGKRWMKKTKPYAGIAEILNWLAEQNIKIAILSNKPQQYTELAVEHLLRSWKFDIIFGSREGIPIKPSPQAVFEILEMLKVDKKDTLFVGDTSIDMQTGLAAGVESVGVSWGFREISELTNAQASYIIHNPIELAQIIKKS